MDKKSCDNCFFLYKFGENEPCPNCQTFNKWTPAVKTNLKEDPKPDLGGQMKDGGERVTYDGGAKREPHQGKGRYDWISPFALGRVCNVGIEFKMGEDGRNAKDEPRNSIAVASCHINQYRCGRRDKDRLARAAWNVMAAMHFEDTGKLMPVGGFESLSPYAFERLAKWCELGGVKYGARNWEAGMPYDHPLDSALRHINCWRKGLKEEDNLAAVLWNLFALMHYECCHMDKFDNIPRYPEAQAKGTAERKEGNPDANGADRIKEKKLKPAVLKIDGNGETLSWPIKEFTIDCDLNFDIDAYIKACDELRTCNSKPKKTGTVMARCDKMSADRKKLLEKALHRLYDSLPDTFEGIIHLSEEEVENLMNDEHNRDKASEHIAEIERNHVVALQTREPR